MVMLFGGNVAAWGVFTKQTESTQKSKDEHIHTRNLLPFTVCAHPRVIRGAIGIDDNRIYFVYLWGKWNRATHSHFHVLSPCHPVFSHIHRKDGELRGQNRSWINCRMEKWQNISPRSRMKNKWYMFIFHGAERNKNGVITRLPLGRLLFTKVVYGIECVQRWHEIAGTVYCGVCAPWQYSPLSWLLWLSSWSMKADAFTFLRRHHVRCDDGVGMSYDFQIYVMRYRRRSEFMGLVRNCSRRDDVRCQSLYDGN